MKRRTGKKVLAFTLAILLMLTMVPQMAFAKGNNKNGRFNDIKDDHWAAKAVEAMVDRGIITGYPDGSFKPDKQVTRAEFAIMMVHALNINTSDIDGQTFVDVPEKHWAYKYVESSKTYLTGFRGTNGNYFKPNDAAVREDMAVALVKAQKLDTSDYDAKVLDNFVDKDAISDNLLKYVAVAVKKGIMKGSPAPGKKFTFNPQGKLTRAEAAVLLYNIIFDDKYVVDDTDDDKIVVDDDDTNTTKPTVSGTVDDGRITLNWNRVNSSGFKYYKVVASINDSTPKYPDNGYLYTISDVSKTSCVIDNSSEYKDGDFGSYFSSGAKYYFTVTAVYDDEKVTGNVIRLEYPKSIDEDNDERKATLSGRIEDKVVALNWNRVDSDGFQYYKVVISKHNASPVYPDDGYQTYITDVNKTSWSVKAGDGYNGGDVGGWLRGGETYYFSITACYDNERVRGNAVKLTVPGSTPSTLARKATLTAAVDGDGIRLNWNKVDGRGFNYYKIVISKENSSPVYPQDGYLTYITDINSTEYYVSSNQSYNGGDFGGYLEPGETYYFSITAVYGDQKVKGNAVKLTFPD